MRCVPVCVCVHATAHKLGVCPTDIAYQLGAALAELSGGGEGGGRGRTPLWLVCGVKTHGAPNDEYQF